MQTNLLNPPISDLQVNALTRLQHGRLILTATSKKTGQHVTLRIHGKNRDLKSRYVNLEDAKIVAIDAGRLSISHNDKGEEVETYERSTGVGWIFADKLRNTDGSRPLVITKNKGAEINQGAARVWLANWAINWLLGIYPDHADMEIKLSSHCARCGRRVSDPISIARGVGPECWGKVTGSRHAPRGE